jgi:hypothetical protein
VYGSKEALTEFVMKQAAQVFELPVVVAQAIAMCKIERLTVKFRYDTFTMQNNATLLFQIIATPDIVIADKEMHFHAQVGQLRNLAQEAGVAFWHYQFELVPKIEHIAQHVHSFSLMLDAVEKVHQTTLLRAGMRNGTRTQMGIGEEIDILHKRNSLQET